MPIKDAGGRDVSTAAVSGDGTMTGEITDPEAARTVTGADGLRYVPLETTIEGDIINDMVGPGHVISRRGDPDELRSLRIEALRPVATQIHDSGASLGDFDSVLASLGRLIQTAPSPAPAGVNERAWELTRPRRAL